MTMSLRKLSPRSNAFQRSSSVANINVVLLGALGVGKSAMTVKFMTRRFIMEYDPFIEDTYSKRDTVDGQEVQINVMDTYDKEVIDLEKSVRWSDVVFVVFSITNRQSFLRAREYLDSQAAAQRAAGKDIPTVLVGNKLDLEQYREIPQSEACGLAAEFDCLYYEISAADDFDEILGLFQDAARLSLHGKDQLLSQDSAPTVRRQNQTQHKRPTSPKAVANNITNTTNTTNTTTNGNTNTNGNTETNNANNDKPASMHQRKPSPTFKLFNKSFKIFN